ncbi:hypothetical protein D3C73_1461880 [compost metagenome]
MPAFHMQYRPGHKAVADQVQDAFGDILGGADPFHRKLGSYRFIELAPRLLLHAAA